MTAEDFEEFVYVEASIEIFGKISNQDLLTVAGHFHKKEEEEDEDEAVVPMKTEEMMEMLVQVIRFVMESGFLIAS